VLRGENSFGCPKTINLLEIKKLSTLPEKKKFAQTYTMFNIIVHASTMYYGCHEQ